MALRPAHVEGSFMRSARHLFNRGFQLGFDLGDLNIDCVTLSEQILEPFGRAKNRLDDIAFHRRVQSHMDNTADRHARPNPVHGYARVRSSGRQPICGNDAGTSCLVQSL